MPNVPPLSNQAQLAIWSQFKTGYGVLTVFCAGVAILAVAWHWSQPKSYALGVPFWQAVLILLVAALLVNGLSFYVQSRYVRGLLQRPQIAAEFSVLVFALRFYGYNLAIAILLSVLGFYPLLLLLFFFASYPIILWLLPYHLIIGLLLGWMIQRQLPG